MSPKNSVSFLPTIFGKKKFLVEVVEIVTQKFCFLFAFLSTIFGKKVFGLEMFPTCVSSEHCALFLLCTSELLAEEEVHVLSLRWLTLLVQVAHPSIRAIFIRAAFRSLATGQAASDRVGGSQF